MAWQGFLLAFCAAITHSCIDLLRKVASKRFSTAQCVCVVALLEGSLSFAFVLGQVRARVLLALHKAAMCKPVNIRSCPLCFVLACAAALFTRYALRES